MDIVTGSFGFIGRHITAKLLACGRQVKTVTTHPGKPNPFGSAVSAHPFNFDRPELLTETLRGCDVLYNTYWIRYEHSGRTFDEALANTKVLFDCAKRAGVQRIVHISVTNASETDELAYYRGKALQECYLRESGIPYSIVRPTVVYGKEDLFINNIAWSMRWFRVLPVFGAGDFKLQPVFAGDVASTAVESAERRGSVVVDAIGPEIFTYKEFLRTISSGIGKRVVLVPTWPRLGVFMSRGVGMLKRDVLITFDELKGLMQSRLCSEQEPNGQTIFSDWVRANRETLGRRYTSELARHYRWKPE